MGMVVYQGKPAVALTLNNHNINPLGWVEQLLELLRSSIPDSLSGYTWRLIGHSSDGAVNSSYRIGLISPE